MQTSLLLARARARAILWPNKSTRCAQGAKRNASHMQRFTLRDFSDETLTRSPLGLLLLAERAHPSESGLKKTLNPKNVRKEHENASTGVVSEVGGEWINEREQVCGSGAGARGER